ncbi:MAG: tyrosine-type recombinase/integrase [Nitrospinae bacterium]|nr:tyrosine-type recombinase/integrase [Nitrospinota bacterium]
MVKSAKMFQEFLTFCEENKKYSPRTVKAYSIDLRQFDEYLIDKHKITDVKDVDKAIVKKYASFLLKNNKVKSVKRKIAVLMSLFNFLVNKKKVKVSPFNGLDLSIKEEKVAPVTLTLGEMKRILKVARLHKKVLLEKNNMYEYIAQIRDIAILELLFGTGAMVTELCEANIKDIDLENRKMTINGQGGKKRVVELCCDETVNSLKAYVEAFEGKTKRKKFFLVNRLGKRISEQSVRFMVIRHAKMAKIRKHVTPHTFRHSLSELLIKAGLDKHFVQLFLGNKPNNTYPNAPKINMEKQQSLLLTKHPRLKIDV